MMLKETTPIQSFLSSPFDRLSPSPSPSPKPLSNEFERIFRYFDEDGDGKISPSELSKCTRTIGEELPIEDAEAVVAYMDSDGDGLLGLDDFVKLVEAEEEEKGRNLREAFGVYEMQGEDCITPKSLRRALERLGHEPRSMEECEAMIQRFDVNGDGVISFDEFRIMMC